MPRRAYGPVEKATRAFIVTLGKLNARSEAMAQAVIRVALLLDGETAGSAATALAREHRQLLLALEPNRANVPAPAPETTGARVDAVDRAKDELEARRQRQQGRPA